VSLSTLYLRLRYPRHTFGPGFRGPWRLRIRGRGRVRFGRDVRIWDASGHTALLTFGAEARIEIGDRVEIDGAGLMSASAIVVDDDAILVDTLEHDVAAIALQRGTDRDRRNHFRFGAHRGRRRHLRLRGDAHRQDYQ